MLETPSEDAVFPVVEIFGPTFQGEGAVAGKLSHFVRFGYCDGTDGAGKKSWCTWCDSMQAVDPVNKPDWHFLTSRQIEDEINALPSFCKTITITGGNPVLHDLGVLTTQLLFQRFTLWVETQGTVYRRWLDPLNVTVSPKPPSAGPSAPHLLAEFMRQRVSHGATTVLKVVVDPTQPGDLAHAKKMLFQYPWADPYLSVVSYPDDDEILIIDRWRRLSEWVLGGGLAGEGITSAPRVSVLPQLHNLLWLNEKGR